ncbi:MAG: AGE family epimerase/isomerase [Saccharofermentans sp.]|nr:AGE family epimerase/isomerase [Saccharofermentans sp.]
MRTTSNMPITPELKRHLIHDLVPFWLNMRDDEFGGFYGFMDANHVVDKKANKGCILNSRILWFFSNVYQLCMDGLLSESKLQDEGYSSLDVLESARHAFSYLKEKFYDQENGGVYWSVTYDGQIADSTKHTYNLAFTIYALVAYYHQSSDEEAMKIARKIKNTIELNCKDEIGYLEEFTVDFQPLVNEKTSENGVTAYRSTNTLINVMQAYSSLYREGIDLPFREKVVAVYDTFENYVYNPDLGRQEMFFDKNFNSIIDLSSFGHDIEVSWFIERLCKTLHDENLSKRMSFYSDVLSEQVYNNGFDGRSVALECENGVMSERRHWWVQAEAMLGFLNTYLKHPEQTHYYDAVRSIWNFVKEYMIHGTHPAEWYFEVSQDGVPNMNEPLVCEWKCPYHVGRMCIEFIRIQESHAEDI